MYYLIPENLSAIRIFYGVDLLDILVILIKVSFTLILTYLVARGVDRTLLRHFPKVISRVEATDVMTIHALARRLVIASIYIAGLMLAILQVPQLESLTTALVAGAGIAGIIIGLAAKDTLANLMAGISLAFFQPFRVGDYLDFRNEYGMIEDLTLRHTVIKTWDNRRIIVPNSLIGAEPITNWSIKEPLVTWALDFKLSSASKIDEARRIMIEEANGHPHVLKGRETGVFLTS
jgi:small conductance mechanosensitive channel